MILVCIRSLVENQPVWWIFHHYQKRDRGVWYPTVSLKRKSPLPELLIISEKVKSARSIPWVSKLSPAITFGVSKPAWVDLP